MQPIQTYGASAAPSNMQFPTAAYLQASQNAANLRARGSEALGQGLAKGIDALGQYLKQSKEEASAAAAGEKFMSFLGKSAVDKGILSQEDFDSVKWQTQNPSMDAKQKMRLTSAMSGYLSSLLEGQQKFEASPAVVKMKRDQEILNRGVPDFGASFTPLGQAAQTQLQPQQVQPVQPDFTQQPFEQSADKFKNWLAQRYPGLDYRTLPRQQQQSMVSQFQSEFGQ